MQGEALKWIVNLYYLWIDEERMWKKFHCLRM